VFTFSNVIQSSRRPATWLVAVLCLILLPGLFARHIAAQTVTVTNVFQNHYHYGYPIGNQNCPSGYTIPSGQYPSTYHLERGHAIHHADPKNAANDYWVYWAHFDNSSYGIAEVAIFKSTTECGPYILQTSLDTVHSIDSGNYGFQPGGWQSRDENIFRDTDQSYNADGTVANYASAYLITASNSLNTVKSSSGSTCGYANDSTAIFKMTSDYLGIDTTTNAATNGANWVFICDQREAPVMFRKDNRYFLITSQAAGWYPSQGGYGVSSNPLTGWTADPINLGNTSTYGGQTSDGFMIAGTEANTYVLTFDHLGGADSKNPASSEQRDTGEIWLPVLLDGNAGTATLNWYSAWSVDNTTGVLTLSTMTNLANGAAVSATVATSSSYPLANAIDSSYTTRWASSVSSSGAFSAAKSTTSALCPVTGATASTTCNPSLVLDLGSVQPIQEIDLSQYMVKGSEPYYTYKIAYSSDKTNWTTLDYTANSTASNAKAANISIVPFSNNITYGFNALPVNFSARYVSMIQTGAVTQNNSTSPYNSFYVPNLFEFGVIQSTAPVSPQPVTVTVTPSSATPATASAFTVAVTVTGPTGQPTPTGYIQLTTPEYTSETYGLVNGASNFTIPAGALLGGAESITVNYRPDAISAPVYGIGTASGASDVTVSAPNAPANVTVTQSQPGTLALSWSASTGASSYVVQRSSDGGTTYAQIATPTAVSLSDTGLNNDSTLYCYRVAAVNQAGPSAFSAPACSTATANFPVTNVTVTQTGPGALTIAYSALANATSYILQRSVGGAAYAQLATATTTSYVDNGLTPAAVSYCYTVAAVFSTGTASASAPVCNTASNDFLPTNLAVTKWASGALRLTWLQNGSGTDTYTVQRAVNGGTFTALTTTVTLPQYVDSGLNNDSDVYCYTVAETQNGVAGPSTAAVCNTPTAQFLTIPNSSFEAPSIPLWSTGPSYLTTALASWTFVGASGSSSGNNSGISNQVSGTWAKANGGGTAALGAQMAYIEAAGSIAQTISGFTSGQQYTVLASASQRQVVAQTANPLAYSVAGAVIGTATPPQSNPYYVDYGFRFVASDSSQTLALTGTSTSATSAVLVDNIRIFPSSGSPVTATQATANIALTVGQQPVSISPVTGAGGATTLFYAIYPSLPAGLSFSTTTGSISGTPTTASPAATYTVTVGDNQGGTASATFTLTINSAVTATVANASTALTVQSSITPFAPVTGTSGTAPLTYAIDPALPSGIVFDTSSGLIEGIPLTVSPATGYTITVTDNNGVQAQAAIQLGVQALTPALSLSCTETVYDGQSHSCSGTATGTGGATVNGNWSYSPTNLTAAGSYSITGTFTSSDSNYASGGTATGTLIIDKATAALVLGGLTQAYTGSSLAASVATTPAGLTVTTLYNGTAATPVTAGSYTVTATINETNYTGTTTGTLVVAKAASSIALGFAPSSASTGQPVTVTATVSGAGSPTGSVAISSANGPLCTVTLNASSIGSCSFTPSTAGTLALNAQYSGDTNHAVSSLAQSLFIYDSSVQLQAAATQLTYPGATNLTACVRSTTSTATGAIQILDGTTQIASLSLQGGGCAYWYIAPGLAAGTHPLTAVYSGDSSHSAGTSVPIAATVSPVAVNLSAACWNATAVYGQSYQCTVNLSSAAGAPAGAITYSTDGSAAVSLALSNGNAQFTLPTPTAGNHTLTIAYAQQGNYAAATPAVESFTVAPAPVVVSLTPSSWYTSASSGIGFRATVTSWSAGAPKNNGAISFYDGTTLLAMVAVDDNGTASWSTTALTPGTHAITATYAGGANYASGSTTATITLTQ